MSIHWDPPEAGQWMFGVVYLPASKESEKREVYVCIWRWCVRIDL